MGGGVVPVGGVRFGSGGGDNGLSLRKRESIAYYTVLNVATDFHDL